MTPTYIGSGPDTKGSSRAVALSLGAGNGLLHSRLSVLMEGEMFRDKDIPSSRHINSA